MDEARLILVEGATQILSAFPAGLRRCTQRKLERLGVELRLGAPVAEEGPGRLELADGTRLEAVFESHGLRLRGPLAWLIWLIIHLVYLPGLRSRLLTLLTWAATLATAEAPVRAIAGGDVAHPGDAGRLWPAAYSGEQDG